MSDRAHINEFDVGVYGIMPSMFDATVSDFLNIDDSQSPTLTGLRLGEQVFTPKGSQGFLNGSYISKQIGASVSDQSTFIYNVAFNKKNIYYESRSIGNTKLAPAFTMSDKETPGS